MHREAATSLRSDPALEPLVDAHGPLKLEPAADLFRRLAVSLIRQQVSIDAADSIRNRLFERVDPTPQKILATDAQTLREAGLSVAKAKYIKNAARAFETNGYDREYFTDLSDLNKARGIGTTSFSPL